MAMHVATVEFQPKIHSEKGASGYHRWSASRGRCPGSVRLIREKAPPELQIEDEVKDDGIEAHGRAEALLRERDPGRHAVLRAQMLNNKVDQEMLMCVTKYVKYVNGLADLPGASLMVEQSFNLSWLADNLFGTTDAVIYAPFSDYYDLETKTLHKGPTLHVIDLKYGFREVDAEENEQALYYALGAYAHLRAEGKAVNRIVVHIWQPRVIGRKNAAVRWSCDEAYLEKFAQQLKDDALAVDDPDAPLNPGVDWCRLCKARTVCPELIKPAWTAARAQILSEGKDPAKALPTFEQGKEDPGTLYMVAMLAKKWAEGTMERTRVEMQRGLKLEGLKMVAGRNSRVHKQPDIFEQEFPRESWPELYEEPVLRSASAIMEFLTMEFTSPEDFESATGFTPKAFEERYFRKVEGLPLVALESDKRAAWSSTEKAAAEWAGEFAPPPPPPPAAVPAGIQVPTLAPPPPPAPPAVSTAFDPNAFFNTKQG